VAHDVVVRLLVAGANGPLRSPDYLQNNDPAIVRVVALNQSRGKTAMLWTIAVILLVLWLLGLVTSYTLGGFIHVLLVLAIVVVIYNLITGRRAL
jgi:hypothetical protein